ncbi:uncharacterized protein LOC141906020 [Tubulanus polymorphus]|uniref:uncharacterized protein LOC141906020 n=1 Tax=Tubulanus polymorphus TaxID=672921 RepID=UPI003DA259EA
MIIYLLGLAICYVILHYFCNKEDDNEAELVRAMSKIMETGRFARRLSCHEIAYLNANEIGNGEGWTIFSFSSTVALHVKSMENVVRQLYRRHPMLRARISRFIARDGTVVKFLEEMAEENINFRHEATTDYRVLVDRELHTQFDEDGPLWRITMLECVEMAGDNRRYTFVMTGLHLICDGLGIGIFIRDFVECLQNHLECGPQFTTPDMERLPLKPGRDEYMESDIKVTFWDKAWFVFERLRSLFHPPDDRLDLTSRLDYAPKTNREQLLRTLDIIPIHLSETETSSFAETVKSNNLRMNAPISAVTALSLMKLLDEDASQLHDVRVSGLYNLRYPRLCKDANMNDLGDYIQGLCMLDARISTDIDDATFWEVAKDFQRQTEEEVADFTRMFNHCKMLKLNSCRWGKSLVADAHVSNWGRFDILNRLNKRKKFLSDLKVEFLFDCFDASPAIVTLIAMTMDDRLSFSLQYQPDIVDRNFAFRYAEVFRETLLHFSDPKTYR